MKKLFYILISFTVINCHKKDDLSDMNNVQMPEYEELIYKASSKKALKVLIVGNSITSHAKAFDIGWKHKSGMAATQENLDYVHLLFDRLKTQYPDKNIYLRYSNWSQFERTPESFTGFKTAHNFNPDILIFQLSDNLAPESNDSFSKLSIIFLKGFKNKFVVSPFFMNSSNYSTSKKIAVESNSHFIDISVISKNKINKASNDNRTDKSEWKSNGIAEHPGNVGMSNIANTIFNNIINQEH